MTRRVVSSGPGAGSAGRPNKGRSIQSRATSSDRPAPRDARDKAPRSVQSCTVEPSDAVDKDGVGRSISDPGAFVDARQLSSEDIVSKTLHETAGTLGIAARPKVVDFSERLKERRRVSLRITTLRVFAALAVVAAISALVWLLFFSSVLRLDAARIQISGSNGWVSEGQIMSIADKQAGKSLLLVSTDDVVTQLKNIPGVTDAKASKQFPKGMSVTVVAQKPAAMLKAGNGSMTAVDGMGRVLNSVKGTSVQGIPVIQVSNIGKGLGNRAVQEALRVLSALQESMRQHITKVTANTQDSVTTELDSGKYVIVWGDSSDLALKKAVVDKIINDPTKIGNKHAVDVSAPLRPIIK